MTSAELLEQGRSQASETKGTWVCIPWQGEKSDCWQLNGGRSEKVADAFAAHGCFDPRGPVLAEQVDTRRKEREECSRDLIMGSRRLVAEARVGRAQSFCLREGRFTM